MQPPPPALLPGAGGPPPPMRMGPNTNRRNNPYSKRGNVQVSGASTSVQPVTDPFAFGRLTPQNMPLNNSLRGNAPVQQGASLPAYSQPVSTHSAYAGDYSHVAYTSAAGSAAGSHGAHTSSSVFSGGSQAVYASSSRGGTGSQEVLSSSPQPGVGLPGGHKMTSGSVPGLLGGNVSSGSVPGLPGGYAAAGSGPGVPGIYTPLGSAAGLTGGYTSLGFGPSLHGSYASSPSGPGLHGAFTSSATGAGLHRGYPSAGLEPDLTGGYTSLVSAPRSVEAHTSRSDHNLYSGNISSLGPGAGSDAVCTPSSSSGANLCPSTNTLTSSGLTGYFTNSSVAHPNTKPLPQNVSAPPYSSSSAFENAFREHQQAGSPNQDMPLTRQNDIRNLSTSGSIVTNATLVHPAHKPSAQWSPMQDGLQMTVSHVLPPTVPPSHTIPSSPSQSYSSLYAGSSSHPLKPISSSQLGQGLQSAPFTSLAVGAERNTITASSQGSSLQFNNSFQAEYNYKPNVGPSTGFSNQPYTEHFYQQPQLSDENKEELVSPVQTPEQHLHAESESTTFQVPADSGTISMFFKGSEAENEEILSSERQEGHHGVNSDSASQYCSGQTYISPLYSQPNGANVPSQAPITAVTNEPAQMGIEQYFSLSVSKQDDNQSGRHPDIYGNDQEDVGGSNTASGQQYDNVENMECVQNQEVPPSESLDTNTLCASTSTDNFRYGPLPGPPLRNNSIEAQAEAGPNLETPDTISHPVRSDSVSSGYSNVSHRSASSLTRPQELTNTFIQQESGKPDESPASFFKQIDSSPMDGDSSRQNPTKDNVHASLSQAPTPSPPKPTGIFQTSANSSFEPVRAHVVGVKPAEVDQAKMVGEVRESRTVQSKTRQSTTMPATSPGNLEQPPDNLETIFIPQVQPFTPLEIGDPGNLLQPLRGPSLDAASFSLEKRPSSRAHGASKKCESPATTLWAQSELPIFGANVLLAPAAPAIHVPPKPRVKEIIQPPEMGLLNLKTNLPGPDPEQTSPEGNISSENLENPPKIGEEEPLNSQASSGYASLLSSPPTDSLQSQPLLVAQPNQICHFPQPINFSMSLPNQLNQHENTHPFKVEDSKSSTNQMTQGDGMSGENGYSALRASSVTNQFLCTNIANNVFTSTNPSQPVSSKSSNLVIQPPSEYIPLNLATSAQAKIKEEYVIPEPSTKPHVPSSSSIGTNLSAGNGHLLFTAKANHKKLNSSSRLNSQEETSGALDFTMSRVQGTNNFFPVQSNTLMGGPAFVSPIVHTSAEMNDKQNFYRQVTKDKQPQLEHKEAFHSAPLVPDSQLLNSSPSDHPTGAIYQIPIGIKSNQDSTEKEPPAHSSKPPSDVPSQGNTSVTPAAYDPAGSEASAERPVSSSAPVVPMNTKESDQQEEQHRPPTSQTLQQGFGPGVDPSAYMYSRHPYDAYQSAYPSAYTAQDPRAAYPGADPRGIYPVPDPRTSHLYYQDVYGAYDPRYRPYDAASAAYVDQGRYRYVEPERPSSRCSRTSEGPSSRQGYGEDYGNTKAGWSASSDYYGYYPSHYDYGDPSRWDPYHPAFDPRSRDPRRYWYDMEQDPYHRNEAYPYPNRQGGSDDPWQYDPRFDRSFDNEPEPSRGPYGDDFDRRSIHSEHSVHSVHSSRSVHSRRSSFSSQSQHSQVYRSQPDLTANAYDVSAQPSSLHSDYAYGLYPSNFNNQPSTIDYSYGYPPETSWPAVEQVPARPLTPEKFSVPHVCARFGPGGHFLKVLPNLPSEGQPALVEVHSMEVMLQQTADQEEMRAFPGPLLKDDTHKVDVINYAQNKATKCFQDENLIDKESSSLLWDFIVLLCRQNGTVVGTDLAELLLQDHKTVWLPGKSPNEANLIDFNNEPLEQEEESVASQLSFLTDVASGTVDSVEKETERFRELLLYGRKKDALESAMKHGLWGHALLLASKMDSRTHARVMTRFANSLPINDPLQTVYQLMSGRMPAASTCCGDEKWGDWRPHLAMVLSNLTNNLEVETRTITTMGDTLASRGLLDASHFCYLMAQVGFGVYTKKTTKLVLIGSNHSWPFLKFSSNEAIHRTEAYEYAQSLGTQPCSLPNFQVFKFIYACRLAEVGLAAQAFHYCEVIAKTILKHPSYYSVVLISQLIEISSQLRFFDPQLKEKPEQELFVEPVWLVRLRHLDGQIKHGTIVYNSDRATPQQYACSTSSSEVDPISHPDSIGAAQEMGHGIENPLLATLMPNMMPAVQEVQLVLPDSQAILERPPPPVQQQLTSNQPSPTFVPGTGFAPPLQNQGFVPTYGIDQMHSYPVPSGESAFPSSPGGESMTELQWNQDPGMRRFSQDSPSKKTFHETGFDYSGSVGKVASGQRSRNPSQSSMRMVYGGRSRTTSESSNHSMGSGRRNSASKQPSPPPIPEFDGNKRKTAEESKAQPPSQSSGRSWFPLKIGWLMGKGKNEAHLPDDTNRSIVWDEKKKRWVNMDEPEGEESKPPPPPPPSIPKGSQSTPFGPGGPSNSNINMFSIRAAGARGRYVDVLNPGGTRSGNSVPPPADLFAPLAPMSIPSNLFVPNAVPEEQQPAEGNEAEQVANPNETGPEHHTETQHSSQIPSGYELPASNADGNHSGELSRSSSMSSLSREVSQHLNQSSNNPVPLGAPPSGAVQFYNPSQFAQPSASSAGSRRGRFGQRKYPTMK